MFSKITFDSKEKMVFFYSLCGHNIVLTASALSEAWLLAAGTYPFFMFWFNSFCIWILYEHRHDRPAL